MSSRRWRLFPGGRSALLPLVLLLAAMMAVTAIACGGDDDDPTPTTAPATATTASEATTAPSPVPEVELEGDLTVFAASSLTDAFTEIGEAFEAEHDGVSVDFNFAASSALSTQINEGSPADVFASADGAQMKVVVDAGNAGESTIFATNLPVVVIPAGSTVVSSFEGLAESGYSLVLAGEEVPVGRYARQIFTNASAATGGISADFSDKVLANLKSNEANVRAVLTKIELGEADAGIVYGTDAAVAGDSVEIIDIPTEYNVIAQYPIASVNESSNPDAAEAFVEFVLSDAGQAILASYGFGPAGS